MMKKSLFILLCALMASCTSRTFMSEEEFDALDKATFDFDIDWSEMDEKPSGVTLYLFPCDENPIDPKVQVCRSNNVDHVKVVVPDQDYSVICINQSESEFANLKFDFPNFEDATVQIKSEEETTVTRQYLNATRAYSANGTLKPTGFATASKSSIKKSTRAFSANGTLKPVNPVKSMSVKVNVFGLNNSLKISGKITNLSSGISLNTRKPLRSLIDQKVSSENWNINLPTSANKPGSISCSFGTFGISSSKSGTRADDEEEEGAYVLEPIELLLDIALPDGTSVQLAKDITEIVVEQLKRIEEAEEAGQDVSDEECQVEIGSSDDTEGSNESDADGMTSGGTLILHRIQTGTVVKVSEWKTTVVDIVL